MRDADQELQAALDRFHEQTGEAATVVVGSEEAVSAFMACRAFRSELLAAARRLVDAVSFDMNGVDGRGGNGGLTSTATIRAADELRAEIDRVERATEM